MSWLWAICYNSFGVKKQKWFDPCQSMNVEITTCIGCRNNCSFCPQRTLVSAYAHHTTTRNNQMMTLTIFKKIVNSLPRHITISFCGMCEPFQNSQCSEMILYANTMKRKIAVFTTLVGVKTKQLKNILHTDAFQTGECKFVVHIPSVGGYENIIPDRTYIQNLKTLVRSGIPIDVRYHGTTAHPLVVKVLKEYGVTAHRIVPTTRAHNVAIPGRSYPRRKIGQISCGKHDIDDSHVILPDGTVVLCCMDYGMKHILGNIVTDRKWSFKKSNALQQVMAGLHDDSKDILCRYCEYAVPANKVSQLRNTALSANTEALRVLEWPLRGVESLYIKGKELYYQLLDARHI